MSNSEVMRNVKYMRKVQRRALACKLRLQAAGDDDFWHQVAETTKDGKSVVNICNEYYIPLMRPYVLVWYDGTKAGPPEDNTWLSAVIEFLER